MHFKFQVAPGFALGFKILILAFEYAARNLCLAFEHISHNFEPAGTMVSEYTAQNFVLELKFFKDTRNFCAGEPKVRQLYKYCMLTILGTFRVCMHKPKQTYIKERTSETSHLFVQ